MVVENIIWILTGIFFILAILFTIFYAFDNSGKSLIGGLICFVCCAMCIVSGNFWAERNNNSNFDLNSAIPLIIHEYPLNEWMIDYKIISIDDKSDTTLVLTKIK